VRWSLIPMPKGNRVPQLLSDLQAFVMENLRAQKRLKAELIWLDARSGRRGAHLYSQRRAEIEADLAALNAVIAARREQQNLRA
jgi:hypothetical protein